MDSLAMFFDKSGPLGAAIVLASVVAATIVLERLWAFRKVRLRDPQFLHRLREAVTRGDFNEAGEIARRETNPLAKALAPVLGRVGGTGNRSRAQLEKVLAQAASREVRSLERFLPSLALIANVTPLLGLMGTVTGMIKAFQAIQNLGGKVNASVLAGGIWEAMLTTAEGLAVAIPALIAHHMLQGKVHNLVADLQTEGAELFDLLEDRGYVLPDAVRPDPVGFEPAQGAGP